MVDKTLPVITNVPQRFVDMGDGTFAEAVYVLNPGGGGGGSSAGGGVPTLFAATSAGTGYASGAVLQRIEVLDGTGAITATVWRNLSVTPTATIAAPTAGTYAPITSPSDATAALQTAGNTTLSAISGKLPASLGAKASTASLPVVLATDQATLPVSAAALPLPAGAATAAAQATGNTSLATIASNTPAPGQAAMSASSPVVVASNQTPIPTASANDMAPLPPGSVALASSTLALLAATSAALPALDATTTHVWVQVPASATGPVYFTEDAVAASASSYRTMGAGAGRMFACSNYTALRFFSTAAVTLLVQPYRQSINEGSIAGTQVGPRSVTPQPIGSLPADAASFVLGDATGWTSIMVQAGQYTAGAAGMLLIGWSTTAGDSTAVRAALTQLDAKITTPDGTQVANVMAIDLGVPSAVSPVICGDVSTTIKTVVIAYRGTLPSGAVFLANLAN